MKENPVIITVLMCVVLFLAIGGSVIIVAAETRGNACVEAVERYSTQYATLEQTLPVAVDAVGAAAARSAARLDMATLKLQAIKTKLDAGEAPLAEAEKACRL